MSNCYAAGKPTCGEKAKFFYAASLISMFASVFAYANQFVISKHFAKLNAQQVW